METIKQVLMRRDGLSAEEADDRVSDAQAELEELLENGGNICEAEELVKDHFGLEPDYLMELI